MAQPDRRTSDLGDRLRALPAFTPPSGGWTALQRRLDRSRRRRRDAWMALAASVVITSGTLLLLPLRQQANPAEVAAVKPAELTRLMAQSRALESSLARERERVSVWDTRSADRAEALQRELSIVDLQLAYARPPSAQRLWRDRVDLLSNLMQTHREAGLINASYVPLSENDL